MLPANHIDRMNPIDAGCGMVMKEVGWDGCWWLNGLVKHGGTYGKQGILHQAFWKSWFSDYYGGVRRWKHSALRTKGQFPLERDLQRILQWLEFLLFFPGLGEFTNEAPRGYLVYKQMGRCRWKIWKTTLSSSQIPENDILSGSKVFLNNTLSLSFLERNCALQRKFVIIY